MGYTGDNLSGWSAVGYGLAGGYYKDAEQRQADEAKRRKLQNSDKAYKEALTKQAEAMAGQTTAETAKLSIENARLHREQELIKNSMAATKMDTALGALTNGDYEHFNLTIKNDLVLSDKFKSSYGASGIRPIDWNNKADVDTFIRDTGIPIESLATLNSTDKQAIGKSFYMTTEGKVLPLDKIMQDTQYSNRMTSTQFEKYKKIQGEMLNIGKRKTTDQVKAESQQKWLEANPDKSLNDFNLAYDKGKNDLAIAKDEALTKNDIALQEAKPITKPEQIQEYIDLSAQVAAGTLPDNLKPKFEAYRKTFAKDSELKGIITNEYMSSTTKFKRGGLFTNDITDIDIIDAKLYETATGNKPSEATTKALKEDFGILKSGISLRNYVRKLKPEEINSGIQDIGMETLTSYFSDDSFNAMSEEKKAKILDSITFNTALGGFIAQYIKSISGSAVAEQEYARLSNLLGGDKFKSIQTRRAAIEEFVNDIEKSYKTKLEANFKDAPSTVLDLASKYRALSKGTPTKTKIAKVKDAEGRFYIKYSDGSLEEIK